MMGTWLPETCWATIRREIKNTKVLTTFLQPRHIPTQGYNITQSSAPDDGHMVARNMLSNSQKRNKEYKKWHLVGFSYPDFREVWRVRIETVISHEFPLPIKKKNAIQSHYRPGQGTLGSRKMRIPQFLDNRHRKVAKLSALSTSHLWLQKISTVFISLRGWIDPRAIVQPEALSPTSST